MRISIAKAHYISNKILTMYEYCIVYKWIIITLMSKDTQKIFIENLIRIRKNKQISQLMLAEKAGISSGIIGEIENGHRNPTLKTIDKIAKALNTPVYQFFLNHDEENKQFVSSSNEEKKKLIIELLNSIDC